MFVDKISLFLEFIPVVILHFCPKVGATLICNLATQNASILFWIILNLAEWLPHIMKVC